MKKKDEIEQLKKDVADWKSRHAAILKLYEELKIRYDEANKHRCNHVTIPYMQPMPYIQQPEPCPYCGKRTGCPGHIIC